MGSACSTINSARPGDIQYKIAIKTGESVRAGTDADVQLTIVGSSGQIKTPILDKWFHDDFERSQTDVYQVWGPDVGDIWMVKIHVSERGFYPDWYVDSIVLNKNFKTSLQENFHFPVWEWVFDGHWVSTGHGKVIDNMIKEEDENKVAHLLKAEKAARDKAREDEMYMRQVMYNWRLKPMKDDPDDKLPGHIDIDDPDKLPPNLKWELERDRVYREIKTSGIKILNLSRFITSKSTNFSSLKEFSDQYVIQNLRKRKMLSCVWKNWMTDYEFGRQFYDGCYPRSLHQIKSVKHLNQKTSFKNIPLKVKEIDIRLAIEEQRCYICDYTELKGYPVRPAADLSYSYEFAPASCLFVVTQISENICVDQEAGTMKNVINNKLVPLAICLNPDTNFIVYCDDKDHNLWLLAKFYVKNAALIKHTLVDHLFYGHMLIEPFAFALVRQMNHAHPLMKLLWPHVQFLSQINVYVRNFMLNPAGSLASQLSIGGGGHLKLMRYYFDHFQLKELDPNYWLNKQGLLDKKGLPEHGFRDCGLPLWRVIENLVRKIVFLHYNTDEDILSDHECQNWFKDARNKGFDFGKDEDYEDEDMMFDGLDLPPEDDKSTTSSAFTKSRSSPLSVIHENIETSKSNIVTEGHGDNKEFNRNFCIPEKLSSREELIWLCTIIIFTVTVDHAASGNGMHDIYGHAFNSPGILRKKAPARRPKQEVSMQYLLSILPDQEMAAGQYAIFHMLSDTWDDTEFLKGFMPKLWNDRAVLEAYKLFQTDLTEVELGIEERNKGRRLNGEEPFTYLLPSNVAIGVDH